MDRFVFRKITFSHLFELSEDDVRKLNKKQVLQLCTDETGNNLDKALLGFAFLGTRYIRCLQLKDVNSIFSIYIPVIFRALQESEDHETGQETHSYHEVLNLITIVMAEAATNLGFPTSQTMYKELYAVIAPLIPESLRRLVKPAVHSSPCADEELQATGNILNAFITYLNRRKFLIHTSKEERELFEEVLVALLNISQALLPYDIQVLNETLQALFMLISKNEWQPQMSSGNIFSDSKEWFKYLRNFLINSSNSSETYYAEFRNLQLFYVAILKLFKMQNRIVLLRCSPAEIMTIHGAFEQAIEGTTNPERKNDVSHLKSIHLQLLNLFSIEDLIHVLKDVPSSTAFLFCKIFLRELMGQERLLDELGTTLYSFIHDALQRGQLVSSTAEFRDLVIKTIIILTNTRKSNPELFAKLLRFFVELTLKGTSHTCPGFRFVFLIQNMLVVILSSQSLFSAFNFYRDMVDQLSSQPNSPARRAFTELARSCYAFMSNRFKTKVREGSSRPTLDLLTPIDKSRTGVLAEEVKEHVDLFIEQRSHFNELQSALSAIGNSSHSLTYTLEQQFRRALERLWAHLLIHRKKWGKFQWMAPFLQSLIRASAKVAYHLKVPLQPIVRMKLPQSTTTIVLIALIDAATKKSANPPLLQFAEESIRKCENPRVKNYLLSIHRLNDRINKLLVSVEQPLTAIDTNFPHSCCERTCCFILANSSDLPVLNRNHHSAIECNLEHAIEHLQRSRQNGSQTTVTAAEFKRLQGLASRFSALLNQMAKGSDE